MWHVTLDVTTVHLLSVIRRHLVTSRCLIICQMLHHQHLLLLLGHLWEHLRRHLKASRSLLLTKLWEEATLVKRRSISMMHHVLLLLLLVHVFLFTMTAKATLHSTFFFGELARVWLVYSNFITLLVDTTGTGNIGLFSLMVVE